MTLSDDTCEVHSATILSDCAATGTVLHCMCQQDLKRHRLSETDQKLDCIIIVILLTEEWAWLRSTPSGPWHCEGFVDCLELSPAWAVLEFHEDVVEKPLCNKVSYFSFSSCVNIFGNFLE